MSFTYSYWRLSAINSTYNVLSIAEIKFYDSGGSQIATTGGTASADDVTFGAASNAFDGNASTFWATSSQATPASPHWIQYQFPSAVTPATYSIAIRNDILFQCPDSWSLQGSNDGSTWTTIGNYSAPWTSAGQVQTFSVGSFGLGDAFRLLITSTDGTSVCSIAEWTLYDSGGTPISFTDGASSALSVYSGEGTDGSAEAFDGDAATYWASNATPTVASPQWLAFRFNSSGLTVGSFSITARTSNPNQTPHDFTLQKSVDGGATWTDIQSFTAATWTNGATQTFGAAPRRARPLIWIIT
jgi:alpha-L-fucosidase 2